ncbi:MAG: methyltransferase [Methylococcales bacterium]|jgi:23S rRNA (cytosine1962-C5)-methyltransferase|nr:methyltransferase [Methylococcales bacterium]MBT4347808.1 methyltransferase [Methylococcales bacterium]MBT4600148.1 methyltransferase [Methylococcales bacterium]MBT4765359.1 methyltransferase [Methylococcales bacterium]
MEQFRRNSVLWVDLINFIELRKLKSGESQRLFHGRGQVFPGFEGINIDWYPPVLLISLYDSGYDQWLEKVVDWLMKEIPECQSVLLQYRSRKGCSFELLRGNSLSKLVAVEHGLLFQIELGRHQNSGLFLDMRNGRDWVRNNALNKKVLNLFAYTCAFSVAALAGGADQVVNFDTSKVALAKGRENHRLNQQNTQQVIFEGVDIFKSFSRIKKHGPYDLLICDPPSYQKGSVDIKRDYKKIVSRIPLFMKKNSLILLCLNSPELGDDFLTELVSVQCPACQFVMKINPPAIFKDAIAGRGLKVHIYRF